MLSVLYAVGFTVIFTLHLVFDGGWGSKKSGLLVGLLLAAVWPLVVLYILYEVARELFRR